MGRINGMEAAHQVPPKVLLIYQAVEQLIATGEDINTIRVSAITKLAGIGKGTAYDYFETKEELIACSLLYQIRKLSELLRNIFEKEIPFADQLKNCLKEIEMQDGKQQCFMRFMHIMTENSAYNQIVRQKIRQKEFEQYLPFKIFEEAIERGKASGEIKKELPTEYIIYSIFTKLFTYMISGNTCECFHMEPEKLRPYVYQSIINELCEKNV